VHRFVIDGAWRASGAGGSASTHGLGLDEAIGLALALDRMPGRLIVHAIEAADTAHGTQMTPAVAAAVGVTAAAVRHDLALA
jgi:hydrogenase maturation protease